MCTSTTRSCAVGPKPGRWTCCSWRRSVRR
jgi:hypothetical protein